MPSPTKTTRKRRATTEDEDVRIVTSPSLDILEELDIHNTFASLEARLDSIEIDLARSAGSRDDDMRRTTGELAVMRARVEDALTAFTETASEVRTLAKDLSKSAPASGRKVARGELDALRREVEARIDGVTAGVGDVLERLAGDLSARAEVLNERLSQLQNGVEGLSAAVEGMASVPQRLAELELAVAELRAR